uniref:Uncharacterized protein n=2 Tax=Heterosigma akashiwo TaxID=2829 RepID=A0A7S3XZF8_HETAK
MMGEVHIEVHEKVDEADALKPADVGGGETSGSGTAEQQQDPIGSNNGWTNTTPLDAAAARVVVFHSLFEHIGPLDAACAYECLPSALCAATNELTIKSDEESASAHNNEAQLATAPSANGHGEKEDNKIRCVVGSISKNNNRKMKQQQLLLKFLSPLQQQQKQQVSSLSSSSSVVKKDGDDMIK